MFFIYIYEGHLWGLFSSEELYDNDTLYCDVCGDSDWLLGKATNREELLDLIRDEDSDYGNWDPEYIEEFCKETFGDN